MTKKETNSHPVALVTGAARRIGAEIVRQLHEAGYEVVVHCNSSYQEAYQLVAELNASSPQSAIILQAALDNERDARDLVMRAEAWKSRLDVLVNNASVFIRTPIQEQVVRSFIDEMWNINVNVPYWLSEVAFPFLVKQRGVIINLTDTHAEKPLRGYSVYCQTKAALKMQTEALAKEYAPHVRVNAVAPGSIAWPEGKNTLADEEKASIIAKIPLDCHGHPRWIAMAALALIQNPYVTGQTLRVDGGRSLS